MYLAGGNFDSIQVLAPGVIWNPTDSQAISGERGAGSGGRYPYSVLSCFSVAHTYN
jgi:hypothetical protein